MRDFIKEQLKKCIDFLERLKEQKTASTAFDYEVNRARLNEAYNFIYKPHYSLSLYKRSFEDYLKQEANKYYKAALINDIRDIVTSTVSKGILELPKSDEQNDLDAFKDAPFECLNIISHLFVSNGITTNSIEDEDFKFFLSVYDLSNVKYSDITLCFFTYLILELNYEILHPFILADSSLSLNVKNPEFVIFDPVSYKLAPRQNKYSQKRLDNYLTKWINAKVTLADWVRYKNVDVFKLLEHLDLSKEDWGKIRNHQHVLYQEALMAAATAYSYRIKNINPISEQLNLAKRDYKLINDLIEGNIDDMKARLLQSVFEIDDWKVLPIHIDALLLQKSYSCDKMDIHSKESFLKAHALFLYKMTLEEFLQANENGKEHHLSPREIKSRSIQHQSPLLSSFKYIHFNSQYDHITDLFNSLKALNLISKGTSLPAFRKIFSGESVNTPIKWTGNLSQLYYFIKCLHNTKKKVENLKQRQWEVTCNCFVQENGGEFEWRKLRRQQKPAKYEFIEKLVDLL